MGYKKIGLICIIIIFVCGIVYYGLGKQGITMNDLKDDFVELDGGGGYFLSYDHGDTVIIKDTILDIEAPPPSGNQTYIWFESTGKDGYGWAMVFYENLTEEYQVGDDVTITLHIVQYERDGIILEAYTKLYSDNIDHT